MCCCSSRLNPDWRLLPGLWAPLSSAAARGAAVRSHLLTHLLQELCCRRSCSSCTACFCQSHPQTHTVPSHCPAGCWHHPRSSVSFTHSLFPQMIQQDSKTPLSKSLWKPQKEQSWFGGWEGIMQRNLSCWTQNPMRQGSTRLKTWCSWCSRCLKGALQPV